jgi:hypothetical protein
MEIKIYVPYRIIYSDHYAVDKLDLNPYLLREGLKDPDDWCLIDINKDTIWVLDFVKEYLSRNSNNND